jgi:hypothetical protein
MPLLTSDLEHLKAEVIVAKNEFKTSQQDYDKAMTALMTKKTDFTEKVFASAQSSNY